VQHWEEAFQAAPAGHKKELVAAVVRKVAVAEDDVSDATVVTHDLYRSTRRVNARPTA
jgi:hypothetical protein